MTYESRSFEKNTYNGFTMLAKRMFWPFHESTKTATMIAIGLIAFKFIYEITIEDGELSKGIFDWWLLAKISFGNFFLEGRSSGGEGRCYRYEEFFQKTYIEFSPIFWFKKWKWSWKSTQFHYEGLVDDSLSLITKLNEL